MKANIVLLIGALVYAILLSRLTFYSWNRFVLLGVIVVSLLLPFLNLPLPGQSHYAIAWQKWEATPALTLSSPSLSSQESNGIGTVFLYTYIAGCIFMLMQLGRQLFKLRKMITTGDCVSEGPLTLVRQSRIGYASFFHYIFIPEDDLEPIFSRQALLHERTHAVQGHSWDILLIEFVKVLFWFNPAIYVLNHYIKLVHEYQADQVVLKEFPKIPYARNLVNMISGRTEYALIHYLNFPILKNRLKMMNTSESKSIQKARFLLLLPLALLMAALFSFMEQTDQESGIAGDWKGAAFSYEQISGPDISAMISGGETLHVGGRFLLQSDGSYQIFDPQGNQNGKGNWSMKEGVLTTEASDQSVQVYQVVELNENNLVTRHFVKMDTPEGEVSGKIKLTYQR
ncbi:M56 family metallopeptidase [Cyclobacterium jeungdonense]|uniref:M56 family metallopeptidase n=1 Tax=Cyclobacterium jeungdonense TaxID=708087 RepID=A0ABT8C641_9BACT|nr:M56 family metallopeptidase [Cyclobacterium jeungdonense]MDN3687562.1 M56 family metallopeptidase [Cyclobacterium jeungdonense]